LCVVLTAKLALRPHIKPLLNGLILLATHSSLVEGGRKLAQVPTWIIEIFRAIDRYGGINSKSVRRMVHSDASDHLKERQLGLAASNKMSTIKPLVLGMNWMEEAEWRQLAVPFMLIHGDSDTVTPAAGVTSLREWCRNFLVGAHIIPGAGHTVMLEKSHEVNKLIEEFLDKQHLL